MESEWTPQMMQLLDIDGASLPLLWDADFLYGPRTATGDDTYVLCEINVSCVTPFPHTAPPEVARLVYERIDRLVDRFLFRERHDNEAALRAFGRHVTLLDDARAIIALRSFALAASILNPHRLVHRFQNSNHIARFRRVGNAPSPQRRMTWHGVPARCPRARPLGATAWAKLRTFSAIMIAVPGNFAHPTAIGFMESIH